MHVSRTIEEAARLAADVFDEGEYIAERYHSDSSVCTEGSVASRELYSLYIPDNFDRAAEALPACPAPESEEGIFSMDM